MVIFCYHSKGYCQMPDFLNLGCCSTKTKDIDEKQLLFLYLLWGGGGGGKIAL